jgi:alpha-glucosidase (family GH31 glycosyl hydrolase)
MVGHAIATCDVDADGLQGLHMGFFLPWALINSWADYLHPYLKSKAQCDAVREYAQLRMRLLPYIYSLAAQSGRTGMPIVRPLPLVYQDQDVAYALIRQFELGDALHVGTHSDTITLPRGRWLDLWTGIVVVGNWQAEQLPIPANRGGHLFFKAGGFIAMREPRQFTQEAPLNEVALVVWPGPQRSTLFLYHDDGISLDYRQGGYACAHLYLEPRPFGWELTWGDIEGKQSDGLKELQYRLEILGDEGHQITEGATFEGAGFFHGSQRTTTFRWGQSIRISRALC